MIKFILDKNFRFRSYGLNPSVSSRRFLRKAFNTNKHKYLRSVVNNLFYNDIK